MLCNTLEVHIPHEIMLIYGKELRLKTMLYCSSKVHVGDNPVPAADWYKNGEYGAYCKICIKKTRKSRAKYVSKRQENREQNLNLLLFEF
jgi:hypothetical protein